MVDSGRITSGLNIHLKVNHINNNLGSANALTAFDYGYAVSEQNKQEWVNLPFVNDCPKTITEWLQ